jgi:alpha-ketoglutarate-dependent taurine dioxygenase
MHHRTLLRHWQKKPILALSRRSLIGTPWKPRNPALPSIKPEQERALDAVDASAAAHSYRLTLRSGDMCFINNLALMHSRTAFEDDNLSSRYLLRL